MAKYLEGTFTGNRTKTGHCRGPLQLLYLRKTARGRHGQPVSVPWVNSDDITVARVPRCL